MGQFLNIVRSTEEWAPVFGWRVRDVAHLILERQIEDLPWNDGSGPNLILYPWWDDLFEIIDEYEGIDVYDVPFFADGMGGPNPSSQIGCENAVFLGALIRVPFVGNYRWAETMQFGGKAARIEREVLGEEYRGPGPDWSKELADDWFTIGEGRIEEMLQGFENLKKFTEAFTDLPPIIQADGNHPDHHEDIEPTLPVRFLSDLDGFGGNIVPGVSVDSDDG